MGEDHANETQVFAVPAVQIFDNGVVLELICVCHHPCEVECNRKEIDSSVAIDDLKRFAADYVMNQGEYIPEREEIEKKPERVAIIGAGPAGLTAAYRLGLMGYGVTIFEALPVVGGMLAVGIPEYRLPRDIIQKEVDTITALGVEIKTNTKVGKDISL